MTTKLSRRANATRFFLGSLLTLMLLLPGAAAAAPQGDIAEVEVLGATIVFYPFVEHDKLVLTVTGPCSFDYRKVFDRGQNPYFKLDERTIDGIYTYQLQVRPKISGEIIERLQEARKNGDEETPKALCRQGALPGDPLVQAEGFRVFRGEILWQPGSSEDKLGSFDDFGGVGNVTPFVDQPKARGGSDPAAKDFVINDDLIVDGSACIGFDCVNGESFGFDTLRLKENNLRIKFDDTSVAASYPRNDWQLTANDSANGGASKFSIDDISGNRTPFTVEANARSHSLYVDDGGRIGSRTSTPSVEIHTIDGDTPTLRLQQDGSSGFAPQTWDVAGNETNFFIRDVTNGSALPFRIRPGAPTSSIFIDVDGDVGVGDSSPDASLDVTRSDGTTSVIVEETSGTAAGRQLLRLVNNGAVRQDQEDTSTGVTWRLTNGASRFRLIDLSDAAIVEFDLEQNGNLTITGTITTGGATCGSGCDEVFSQDYDLPSIDEHAAQMWAFGHLPSVGPTGPGIPMNLTERSGDMLNELEKAHIYIDQLDDRLKQRDAQVDQLNERLARLEALLALQPAQD